MNYPNGKKSTTINHTTNYSNRGMTLENELNQSNEYYRLIDKAYIYKKPTPIKITKVDYPSRDKAVIKEAFFTIPSTTDYNGLYNNIHPHQIKHLENINKHNGIAFIIIRFTTINKTYLITINKVLDYINNNDRKSIPLKYFEDNAYLIKDSLKPTIDYLKIIDQILEVSK